MAWLLHPASFHGSRTTARITTKQCLNRPHPRQMNAQYDELHLRGATMPGT